MTTEPATAKDLWRVEMIARSAAMRARDNSKGYIVAIKRKNSSFGFAIQATNDLKPCHASFSGNVAITAENMLYSLACGSPVMVEFDPWDIDEYLDGK